MPPMKKLAAVPLAALLTVSACSGSNTKPTPAHSPSMGATSAAPSTEPPSPDPSAGAPPNVGKNALRVGQTRMGTGIHTTVLEVIQRKDAPIPSYLRGESDAEGALVRVKSCVVKGSEVLAPDQFAAEDASGGVYSPSSSSWDAWPPLPKYPFTGRKVRAGQCINGWVLILVPNGVAVRKIDLSGGDDIVAEWRVKG